MKKTLIAAALAATLGAQVDAAPGLPPNARSSTFLSPPYTVDKKYASMVGPQSKQLIHVAEFEKPELIWVLGYKAEMVGPDGETLLSQEFMCHSNLDINMIQHLRIFDLDRQARSRVFTLSQGQQEIRFPPGFGFPMISKEAFSLQTQVLNLNIDKPENLQVRHRITVHYVREKERTTPLKPLFLLGVNALVLLEGKDAHFGVEAPDPNIHGEGCSLGTIASDGSAMHPDPLGRMFAGHWLVKPGREVNHTNVTRLLELPFDTTVHYAAVHLHPFAESLELRDLTTNRSLFVSKARNQVGKIGLTEVDYYSSAEGFPLFKNHEYEVISTYNNTSGVIQDAMGSMFLYGLDKQWKGLTPLPKAGSAATPGGR